MEKGTQEQLNSFLHHWVESPVVEDSFFLRYRFFGLQTLNMVIFMLQSHSDALNFLIDTFHIRRHKIIFKNLRFQVKH